MKLSRFISLIAFTLSTSVNACPDTTEIYSKLDMNDTKIMKLNLGTLFIGYSFMLNQPQTYGSPESWLVTFAVTNNLEDYPLTIDKAIARIYDNQNKLSLTRDAGNICEYQSNDQTVRILAIDKALTASG